MKKTYQIICRHTLLVLLLLLLGGAGVAHASTQIGYGTVNYGYGYQAGNFPIFQQYGTPQYPFSSCSANCSYLVNSITISTNDTVQLYCLASDSNIHPGIKFTGPGTFYPSSYILTNAQIASGQPVCAQFFNNGYFFTFGVVNVLAPANNPPSNLTIATTSDSTRVILSWKINSSSQTGFDIERSINNGSFVQIATAGTSTTSYTDTNLTSGVSYQYRVAAILSGGNTGYSNVASVKPSVQVSVVVITLSGVGTSNDNQIFSWVNNNITIPNKLIPTVQIPSSFITSVAKNTNDLRKQIALALAGGNKVLVIGHSIGSIIAYNVVHESDFANQPIVGVYVDPPYAMDMFNVVFSHIIPGLASSIKISSSGIVNDPGTVDWTNGKGLAHIFIHDPWDANPNYGNNRQNLANLALFTQSALDQLEKRSGNPSHVSPSDSLSSVPTISNVQAGATSSVPVYPGQTITISGSGFGGYGNSILIKSISDPGVYYTMYDVPSNGSSMTVVFPGFPDIPSDTLPGSYTVQVAGLNSDWSNTYPISVLGAQIPAPTIKNSPLIAAPGDSATIEGSGFNIGINNIRLFISNPTSGFVNEGTDQSASIWEAFKRFIFSLFAVHAQTTDFVTPDFMVTGISSDGSKLSFTIPADMPYGTYSVEVAVPNGKWSSAATIFLNLLAPQSLTSVPTIQGSVNLSWSNGSATGMTGVSVERSSAQNSSYKQIALLPPTATSYTDTGLLPSTTYYYNVRFQYGTSQPSNGAATSASSLGPVILPVVSVPIYGPYAATSTVTTLKPSVLILPASSTSVQTLPAIMTYSCPSGGVLSGASCITRTIRTVPCSINNSSANYSSANYNSACQNGVISTSNVSSAYLATPTYVCPAGYTLHSSNKTCSSNDVSFLVSAGIMTADVWNAIVYLLMHW